MKKTYAIIGVIFFIICSFFIISETYKLVNALVARNYSCGHIIDTTATIIYPGWNGKNENGKDKSCYVKYFDKGRNKFVLAERWNVGNCDYGRKIKIQYASYICPK